ncbi:MAG: N-acetyltransferase, partial [Thermus sp.]
MDWPQYGRVTLKPFSAGLTEEEWKGLYETFRDPEVAE